MTYTKLHPIKLQDVRAFFGAIQKRKTTNTRLVYITTTWVYPNAINFCKENGIEIWDYHKIIEMLEIFPFKSFLNYIIYSETEHNYKEIFAENIIEYIEDERQSKQEKIRKKTIIESEIIKKEIQPKIIENSQIFERPIYTNNSKTFSEEIDSIWNSINIAFAILIIIGIITYGDTIMQEAKTI